MEMPARGDAAFRATIRFASAPTTCCCAAVGGSAALRMRHTPCGCRSAYLVEVRSNHRLPKHLSMRRAQQCRYFASSLPPSKRHSRLTTVRRGWLSGRDSQGFMAKPCTPHPHCAARAAIQAANCQCRGSRGPPLAFLWGFKGGILFGKYPLWCRGAHAALPPALTREKVQPFRAILPSARRAESTCAPAGAKKEHPYGCSFSNR